MRSDGRREPYDGGIDAPYRMAFASFRRDEGLILVESEGYGAFGIGSGGCATTPLCLRGGLERGGDLEIRD